MAYEYTITFKREVTTEGSITNTQTDNTQQPGNVGKPKVGKSESSTSKTALYSVAIAEGKRYGMYALSNVGKYTGNSALQTDINNGIEAVSLGVGMITNMWVTIAATAFNTTKTIIEHTFDDKQEQSRVEAARIRNGYTDVKSIITSRRH